MKNKKITTSLLTAGMVLAIGITPFVHSNTMEAATLISQSDHEKVMSFTKKDLKEATGIQLEPATVQAVHQELKQQITWETLGYSTIDAQNIATRFTQNTYQALGILTDIANHSDLQLKVITINNPYLATAKIGTFKWETVTPEVGGDHETADNELTTPTPTVASLQEIDVEIEYDENEIEFTYEIKSNGIIEATYEDESADLELEGKAAQDKIMTLLDGLSIKTATNEQIKEHIKEHITKKLAVNEQVKQYNSAIKTALTKMSMLFFYERIEIFIRMIEKLSLIRPGCYNIVMQVKGVLNMPENLQLVIITGMSGAGKTVAVQSFEDMGYFCIDNLPPSLIPKFWELIKESGKVTKIALVIDLRSRTFFREIQDMLVELENTNFIDTTILFLDATDEELVSRYKETRRAHPMAMDGLVTEGIRKERAMLEEIKADAQLVIDTTDLSPRQLRERLNKELATRETHEFRVEMVSFGFKYGLPIDADIVMDVRFLPNPHYIDELRPLTGMDQPVYDYVMGFPETDEFYTKFIDLLRTVLPGYKKEGKSSVTIAIGCTGGQHRSVALTERVGAELKEEDYHVNITHRDRLKRKETVNRS